MIRPQDVIHGRTRLGVRVATDHGQRPTAAFTVDVEDWYQSCFDYDAPITERVVRNVDRVLALLDECGVKGTFFVQGLVAETFPSLVQRIVAEGHELQSHGYSHRPLQSMSRAELRQELERSRGVLEDAAGTRITAFRAPDFSIDSRNLWALEVLAELGFEVDSSIFPAKTRRYGIAGWEPAPERLTLANGAEIVEAPVAVWSRHGIRLPVAGGGYFRLLPYRIIDLGLRQIAASGRPVVVYCHPYEFGARETDDYRGKVPARTRLVQGLGRGRFVGRVQALLRSGRFGTLADVLRGLESG